MNYTIRNATMEDLPRIDEIYDYARSFMANHGNPTQWGKTEPPRRLLEEDIQQRRLYVITDAQVIHGVFYFFIGPDPTYAVIVDGSWRHDKPYGTIHRIAADGSGGILKEAVSFCTSKVDYLRIDTHDNNTVMQSALAKLGFHRCGTIICDDGTPRIAYDYI